MVEGFGIPVLDAACLGAPTIASDCESHLEIQSLYDFEEYVLCLETLNSREWAEALRAVAGKYRHIADQKSQTRQMRIRRYEQLKRELNSQLKKDIVEILN